jgi:23S rRNA pseudouridine1911/1915/1917 synthase
MAFNQILFEDNHIIAINKRPSDIVQGDKTGDTPLSEKVKEYIGKKYHKAGNVFLGTVHRIDRPVSGVVLFARTGKALERLNQMFRDRLVSKTYWAVVKSLPSVANGNLIHYLKKDEAKNKSKAFEQEKPGTLRSELSYKLIGRSDLYYLLEIKPITGRHHQIRAQLAAIGCAIKGDIKYGFNRTNKDASIHLHALKIQFTHPVKNESIEITARPPDDAVWNYFWSLYGNNSVPDHS